MLQFCLVPKQRNYLPGSEVVMFDIYEKGKFFQPGSDVDNFGICIHTHKHTHLHIPKPLHLGHLFLFFIPDLFIELLFEANEQGESFHLIIEN